MSEWKGQLRNLHNMHLAHIAPAKPVMAVGKHMYDFYVSCYHLGGSEVRSL